MQQVFMLMCLIFTAKNGMFFLGRVLFYAACMSKFAFPLQVVCKWWSEAQLKMNVSVHLFARDCINAGKA